MKNLLEKPLLIVKIVLGVAFIAHGISKFMNYDATVSFFQAIGLPVFMVTVIALLELLAGIAVLFSKTMKYGAIAIMLIMIGAIISVKHKAGYMGGYEMDIAYFAMAWALAALACKQKKEKAKN